MTKVESVSDPSTYARVPVFGFFKPFRPHRTIDNGVTPAQTSPFDMRGHRRLPARSKTPHSGSKFCLTAGSPA